MTDKQLSALGEKIYSAVIAARLSPPALSDLAGAIQGRRSWQQLNERTKLGVLVVTTKLCGCDQRAPDSPTPFTTVPPLQPHRHDVDFDDLTPGGSSAEDACVTGSQERSAADHAHPAEPTTVSEDHLSSSLPPEQTGSRHDSERARE